MRSVNNTPIEGLWHWFLQTFGQNIKDVIRGGFVQGIYNPNNAIHPYVTGIYTLNIALKFQPTHQTIILLAMAKNSANST
jgi:hypothetical protein